MTADAPAGSGLHAEAVALLERWRAPTPGQEALRREYLAFLAAEPGGVWRDGPPVHLTASCFVLDRGGSRTLLTHHRKGGFWVQLGGHCEGSDHDLAATALREAREESGVAGLVLHAEDGAEPIPVDLDAHELSAAFGRCRRHLDVAFVAVTDAAARTRVSAESIDVAWFAVDDLPSQVATDLPARLAAVVRQLRSPAAAAASSPSR